MTKPLRLHLDRVVCSGETFQEWGRDEIYLLGFGITKGGHRFAIPMTSLGSFGSGETSGAGYPKALVDEPISDMENGLTMALWLVERDGGNLVSHFATYQALLAAHFPARYDEASVLALAPDARNLLAFAQTMVAVRGAMDKAARSNVRADDVFIDRFVNLVPPGLPPSGPPRFEVDFVGNGGAYRLTFSYHFPRPPLVIG